MKTINTHEAKTHLSKLLEMVQNGSEIIIAKAGSPVAVLSPYKKNTRRTAGVMAGKINVTNDFDTLPSEFMSNFS